MLKPVARETASQRTGGGAGGALAAIVPARGGSKGLPGKNLRPLAGDPLIVHSLRAALAARLVSRIIVSTDCDEIARVCAAVPGVEVPFRRPAELATDAASAVDVYLHAADWLAEEMGTPPQALCVLLPTSPLRRPGDVDAAIALFHAKQAEVVISVTETKPVAWLQTMDADGRLSPAADGGASVANRQDLPGAWQPNGSVYVLDIEALRRTRTYFGPATYGLTLPPDRSVDIDTETDFLLAETLLRQQSYEPDRCMHRAV